MVNTAATTDIAVAADVAEEVDAAPAVGVFIVEDTLVDTAMDITAHRSEDTTDTTAKTIANTTVN